MRRVIKYGILLLLIFRICLNSSAQKSTFLEQPRLNYLTTKEGLPQNTIDCILKDSKGFMWFGTWNGLCRFDGYTFQIFQSQQEEWLPGNFIHTLCEDQNGNLWVGTYKGLAYFDYSLMKFTEIPLLTENFGGISITHIINDKDNNIWVASAGNGIWKIKNEGQTVLSVEPVFENQLTDKIVNHLCLLPDNHLLAGTVNGLSVINLSDTKPSPLWETLSDNMTGLNISTILADHKGNIWLGTTNIGLYQFNPGTLSITYFGASNNNPFDLNHLAVNDIIEDRNGIITVGTLGGLNYYNPSTQHFTSLPTSSEERKYLNNPFINSLYADNLGNIWIGTEKGGINHYNTYQKPFNALTHETSNPNSISHNTINSIFTEDDVLWVGTAGGGVNRISDNGLKTIHFQYSDENPQSISSDFITCFIRDSQNHMLVGTWGGGLNKLLSEKQNRFEILVNIPGDNRSLCSSFISSLEYLDNKHILIGTLGGLDIYNPEENIFLHVHEKMNIDEPLEIGCLLTDSKNRVWVGTENGLYRFKRSELLALNENTAQIDFEKYLPDPTDSVSLAGNYVTSLFEAHDGNIWIGTYGDGICKYTENANGGGFINYNQQNGLCNNVAYGIEEDTEGNLWISTDNGLSRFDPISETFQNFYSSDGLLSDQFYWSASCSDDRGNLYFGGVEGLNYFNPAEFESYPNIPQPVFTQFSVFSDPVIIGEKYHSKVILNEPISETQEISLSYKDAVFSIEFSALDYFQPGKIKYAYQMEGVDQDWVEVPASRRFANYTNLSGGRYTFKVKAANSDGLWSENYTTLSINIIPPFWETAWFQFLAVLFIIGMVLIYIRYRTQFLKEQKRKLEKQVRERTFKIEEQKEELEKQNLQIAKQRDEVIELNEKVKLVNQLRLRFFTNISHEFRTPLTLIIDPLEQLMNNMKGDADTQNTLNIINRNAQRLLHLINQLLYFRRIETGKLKLNVSKGNLQQFLYGIFESFKDLAEHQEINYRFLETEITEETWFDAEKVENVFYNLLSNAFKNTPPSGAITLKVEKITEEREDCIPTPFVAISVVDTGRGISEEHMPHIFNRFYNNAESGKQTDFTSSGIGLALTYEIVQALNGEIKVESEPRKGSTFTVYMPYSKNRFESDQIHETSVPTEINLEGRVNVLTEHIVARNTNYELDEGTSGNKTKPTILIVEDNFDLRSFLLQTLRSGYRVLGAENGKIGLEMAKKYSPELIISDVMMPVMDGIELCSRLKKNIQTSHIPIILLTAKNMVESWIEGLETGADDYIPKPFNLQILEIKMRNIIESRRKIKNIFSSPEPVAPEKLSSNKLDEEFITKAYQVLEKNYIEPNFSVEQFAREMFVSRSLLYKKIKALTDLNITDFINSYKLKKSVELIKTTDQSISEIAFKTGFNDPKYFSRIFKKFYGSSPSEFSR